jgi:hypothetical protein
MPCESVGYISFGSFNNVAKVNAQVVRLWSRILTAVPHSRMLFKSRAFAAQHVKDSCATAFAMAGIDRYYIYIYICVCVCVCVCVYIYIYIYAQSARIFSAAYHGMCVDMIIVAARQCHACKLHTHKSTCTHIHNHIQTRMDTLTHTRHACMQMVSRHYHVTVCRNGRPAHHIPIHIYIHIHMNTYMHECIRTHTCMHADHEWT